MAEAICIAVSTMRLNCGREGELSAVVKKPPSIASCSASGRRVRVNGRAGTRPRTAKATLSATQALLSTRLSGASVCCCRVPVAQGW